SPLREGGFAEQIPEQEIGLRLTDRVESDDRVPRSTILEELGTGQAEDEDRSVPGEVPELHEDVQEGGFRPLDVLDHEDRAVLTRRVRLERSEMDENGLSRVRLAS